MNTSTKKQETSSKEQETSSKTLPLQLEGELAEVQAKMKEYLKQLGY